MTETAAQLVRISMVRSIQEGESISFETVIDQGASLQQLDALTDKLASVMARQHAMHMLPILKEKYRANVAAYERGQQDIDRLDRQRAGQQQAGEAKGRRTPVNTAATDKDRQQAVDAVVRWKEDARKLEAVIDDHEKLIERVAE